MKQLKIKDYIFLGLISIVGLVIYLISVSIAAIAILPLGAIGYVLSNGIFGLLGGTFFVFMCHRCAAKGTVTIFSIILLVITSIFGGGYLPFLIFVMLGGIFADFILMAFGYRNLWGQLCAWIVYQWGILAATLVPVWFFSNSFAQDLAARGSSETLIQVQLQYSSGLWGLACIVMTAILSALGIVIARTILNKYLIKEQS